MKKKKIMLGTLGSVFLIICVVFLYLKPLQKENWEGLEVINIASNKRLYSSLNEVEKKATIIVEVEAGNALDQVVSTFYDSKIQKEMPSAGYTKRELKITKVYQGDVNVGDKIILLHDYFIWENSDKIKQLISISDYKPMKKGDKYLLFLAWDKGKEGYYVVGDYQGIYPLEDADASKRDTNKASNQEFEHVYSKEEYSWTLAPIYAEVREKYLN